MKLKLFINTGLLALSFSAFADNSTPPPAPTFAAIDMSSASSCFQTVGNNFKLLQTFTMLPWAWNYNNAAEANFYRNYQDYIGILSNPYAVQGVNSQCNTTNGTTICTSTYPVNCQLLDSTTYPAQAGQIVTQQAQQEMSKYATGTYPNGVVASLNSGTITCTFPGGTPFPYSSATCTVSNG